MASILNVDKIRATGSTTDGLTVDSGGRVDMPNTVMYDTYRLTADHSTIAVITAWEKPDNSLSVTVGDSMSVSSGIFTFPRTGVYRVAFFAGIDTAAADSLGSVELRGTTDNSNYELLTYVREGGSSDVDYGNVYGEAIVNISDTANRKVKLDAGSLSSGSVIMGHSDRNETYICFQYLAPAQ